MPLLLKGLLIGFSIAAPVGPIGVLCIQRTIARGRVSGLLTGLGAASADACYGAIAAFGLSAISNVLVGHQVWIRLLGGLFLLYLGATTFRARPASTAAAAAERGLLSDYATTFALTGTNPMTILSFVAIFAGLGLTTGVGSASAALTMVSGVFAGSALWWLLLSGGVSVLRTRVGPAALVVVNRASGAMIALFGLAALASAWRV